MNGEIMAKVRKLSENKPLSFTSMNGEIDIRLPADAQAKIRLRTQNGAILTDFDDKSLVTKTESVRGNNRSGHYSVNIDGNSEIRTAVREAWKQPAKQPRPCGRLLPQCVKRLLKPMMVAL
jgi:hypothetical protein